MASLMGSQGSRVETGGSAADLLRRKAQNIGQQSQRGAKKYSDGMRDAGLSSGDITRESSGGESLSGSGNARVLFAGRRRPK